MDYISTNTGPMEAALICLQLLIKPMLMVVLTLRIVLFLMLLDLPFLPRFYRTPKLGNLMMVYISASPAPMEATLVCVQALIKAMLMVVRTLSIVLVLIVLDPPLLPYFCSAPNGGTHHRC